MFLISQFFFFFEKEKETKQHPQSVQPIHFPKHMFDLCVMKPLQE